MSNWKIWIDTGGTFTDCLAFDERGNMQRIKILSNASLRGSILSNSKEKLRIKITWPVEEDIFEGYSIKINAVKNKSFHVIATDLKSGVLHIDENPGNLKRGGFEMFSNEEAPILASRIATKTPLNAELPIIDMRLGSTKGTNALLENKGARVAFITTKGMKGLLEIGTQQRPELFALNVIKNPILYSEVFEVNERIHANGEIIKNIHDWPADKLISSLRAADIETVAISFLNSYRNNKHERYLSDMLNKAGFQNVSASSKLANEIGILPRAQTSIVNAYLSGIIGKYLGSVKSKIKHGTLKVMTSAGGLTAYDMFLPKDSLLSGPAGGVVGSAKVAGELGFVKILTFDMGGTSTDVSRYDGKYDYKFISEINKVSMYSPTLAIETVAAGGGSICGYDGYKLTVGPESSGAFPGPACYGNNGPLSITDINLLLGRLDEANFSIPLNLPDAQQAFKKVIGKLHHEGTEEDILLGFLRIANEKMAEAIRKISISKGYDPKEYALLAFGGAGGQHACSIADLLKINKIIIPFDAGLLSAFGMGKAEIERFVNKQLLQPLDEIGASFMGLFDEMQEEAFDLLVAEGIDRNHLYVRDKLVYLRFKGQENCLEIAYTNAPLKQSFKDAYESVYGHWLDHELIEVESIKLIAAYVGPEKPETSIPLKSYRPVIDKKVKTFLRRDWKEIGAYFWEKLNPGAKISGPALLLSENSTVFVEESWDLSIEKDKNAILVHSKKSSVRNQAFSEMAELELFTNRFKSVADDMGAILQRTSFSVNVKDRMDFSCAVMNNKGYLVANAPHIPVHLGSLGICVRKVIETLPLEEGDVVITNHPAYGGSHLPDVTLIAPVFHEGDLIAYVANRAHHAELGGKTPGSMPTNALNLAEEGIVINPTYLLKNHQPRWEYIKKLLSAEPYPSRSIDENLADLNGALASIKTGADGLKLLCQNHGKKMVSTYMERLLAYSGNSLFHTFKKLEKHSWDAEEFLDDGNRIKVNIEKSKTGVVFDFSGTSPTHSGNLNATQAILNSAVIYVLRLMMEEPLPLNEGIMKYVKIIVPECMLNPKFDQDPKKSPAVVGGNTETSQRIVDTLIKALKLAACSQGTMNNLIFGNERFGFYETLGGGVGAGNGFHGADAVHQHMTNTRITDPEVLEFRYPVMLEEIGVRQSSGGKGKWHGGNGIIRQIHFEEDVTLTLLSQHRIVPPYGMNGGSHGKTGKQVLIRANGKKIELKGIETIEVSKGDVIRIETPGGGGYGKVSD